MTHYTVREERGIANKFTIIADQAVPDIGEPTWHQHRSTFFDLFKRRDS